jgi:hypothetical protein
MTPRRSTKLMRSLALIGSLLGPLIGCAPVGYDRAGYPLTIFDLQDPAARAASCSAAGGTLNSDGECRGFSLRRAS